MGENKGGDFPLSRGKVDPWQGKKSKRAMCGSKTYSSETVNGSDGQKGEAYRARIVAAFWAINLDRDEGGS